MLSNSGNFETYIIGIKKIRKRTLFEDDEDPIDREEYKKKLLEKQAERSRSREKIKQFQ